jgi:hypothetical protein
MAQMTMGKAESDRTGTHQHWDVVAAHSELEESTSVEAWQEHLPEMAKKRV